MTTMNSVPTNSVAMNSVTGTRLPLVLAPMAGGPSTPALCAAVAAAGGLPFLPAGYLSADVLGQRIAELGELTDAAFGVNVFVPAAASSAKSTVDTGTETDTEADYQRYRNEIIDRGFAQPTDLPAEPLESDDDYPAKIELLLNSPAQFISFTFGYPDSTVVERLHQAGKTVILAATSAVGVDAALTAGADILTVQGIDAGGHRATVAGADDSTSPTAVELTAYATSLPADVRRPVIAGGGIGGPDDVAALLDAGAAAVQVGTQFLVADEAGTRGTHRAALTELRDRGTVVTKAFTGKPARAITNRFIEELDEKAPELYPALHFLTGGMRRIADENRNPETLNLWAGTAYPLARPGTAEQIVHRLFPDNTLGAQR